MNEELPDVQARFRKGIKLPTYIGSQRKQGNSRKTCTSVSLTPLKPLTVWITTNHASAAVAKWLQSCPTRPHRWQPTRLPRFRDSQGKNTGVGCQFLLYNKPWKILKEMQIPVSPPYLPPEKPACRSRSNSQNQTWNKDWFQIRKGVHQGCILSPCLFNLHAEYIRVHHAKCRARKSTSCNNLRYTHDTTPMAESKEELKSLERVKEESEKAGLNLNIQKTKIMTSGPISLITSWQIDGEKV